ncbi:hypothetical protein GGX14DRAFT_606979 [Mycena pura]|uniref:Uncharacterized protein n=1 Tax=Mycena pura TaxID=153505 RepID=A0AAD6YIF7_9AGAR|nr:hypothetical protein GGX14DRAFT_606979 [Mycena pura]
MPTEPFSVNRVGDGRVQPGWRTKPSTALLPLAVIGVNHSVCRYPPPMPVAPRRPAAVSRRPTAVPCRPRRLYGYGLCVGEQDGGSGREAAGAGGGRREAGGGRRRSVGGGRGGRREAGPNRTTRLTTRLLVLAELSRHAIKLQCPLPASLCGPAYSARFQVVAQDVTAFGLVPIVLFKWAPPCLRCAGRNTRQKMHRSNPRETLPKLAVGLLPLHIVIVLEGLMHVECRLLRPVVLRTNVPKNVRTKRMRTCHNF